LTWIGTVSFGLYLWHVSVIWSLRTAHLLPLDPISALPIALAPSLALTAGSWYLVKQPVLRHVRASTSRSRRPRQPDRLEPARRPAATAKAGTTLPGVVQVP